MNHFIPNRSDDEQRSSNVLLRSVREAKGLTREAVAGALNIHPITLWRWEGGLLPSRTSRLRLCTFYGVSEAALGWSDLDTRARSNRLATCVIDPYIQVSHTLVGQQALLEAIAASPCRIIGLTGMPGCGKTAVAQALLTSALPHVDGIFWASFGKHASPLRHLQRWLLLLGVEQETLPDQFAEALDLFQILMQGQTVLIVLDDVWSEEDLVPYQQLGSSCRLLITTRQPGLASSLCERVYRPQPFTDAQALQLLIQGLTPSLVHGNRMLLRALCQQVGNHPATLEQMRLSLRQEARTGSPRRFQDAVSRLFQPACYLQLQSGGGPSLATMLGDSLHALPLSAQQAFLALANHFPAAPATFSERHAAACLHTHALQIHDLDILVDRGLLSEAGRNRYQWHPVVAAFARLISAPTEAHGTPPATALSEAS